MKWLAQRQRERRWWTASVVVAICGLLLGVIGIIPAFADLRAASCEAIESDGSVIIAWSDVPDGLALTILAEDANGDLAPVGTDRTIAGFGPGGSWTGDAHPGAVAYLIHGDPVDGGGTIRCDDPVSEPPVEVPIDRAVGAGNPGFTTGTCPTPGTREDYGWAFVASGTGMVIESLRVEFASAGAVTSFVPGPTRAHAYLFTSGPDEIVRARATVAGPHPDRISVELVFVCSPDETPDPDSTPTTAPVPRSPAESTADDGAPPSGTSSSFDSPPRIEASLGVDCAGEAVVVELTNLGSVTGVVEIVVDDVVVDVATVEAGPTETLAVEASLSGATVEIRAGGVVVAASTFDAPCVAETPDVHATVTVDCAAGTITVISHNDGDGLDIVTVDIDDERTRVELMPGSTESVSVERNGRNAVPVAVLGGARTILSTTVDATCADSSPELSAEVALVCDATAPGVRVVAVNGGDAPGSVAVDIDGSTVRIDVAAGTSESTVLALRGGRSGDEPVTVAVRDADGGILAQLTEQAPCATPEPAVGASAVLDCVVGQIRVTVTNTGDADGVATVRIGDTTQSVVAAAAGRAVVTAEVQVDTTAQVRVTDGQRSLLDETYSEICDDPSPELRAEVTRDCGNGKVHIAVTNGGDAAAEATLSYGDGATTVRVGPGDTIDEHFPVAATNQTVRVSGPGGEQATVVEVEVDPCEVGVSQLRAEGQVDCQLGEVVVSIFNDGDAAATVTWSIDTRTETAVVAPGASLVVSQPVAPGVTNTWSVSSLGQSVAGAETIDACRPETPVIDAELVIDCGNDEVVVRVSNSGAVDGTARIVINGEVVDIVVLAGEVIVVTGDLPVNGNYLVDVSSDATTVLTRQGTAAECRLPDDAEMSASIAFSCRWDEAVVQVENPSGRRRDVTVTVDGNAETVAVAAGDDTEVAHPLVEDQPYEITVVDEEGRSLAFARGVHDCVDVGGATVTNPNPPAIVTATTPMQLPTTGADSGALAGAGLVFMAAGLLAVRASQFRRIRITTA